MYRSIVTGLLMVCLWTSPVPAQDNADVAELKRLIGALQEKLQGLESAGRRDSRVTEIGGAWLPRDPDKLIVRTYDVGDLFSVAPPYPALRKSDLVGGGQQPLFPSGPGGPSGASAPFVISVSPVVGVRNGSGGTADPFANGNAGDRGVASENKPAYISPPPPSALYQAASDATADARIAMDDLIEAITSTISPTTWDDVGGPASIASLGTTLIISASEDAHDQINSLLALLRKQWGSLRTISVRAWWVWLTDAEFNTLLPGDGRTPIDDKTVVYGLVDDLAFSKLLAERQGGKSDPPAGYRSVITCYNGQTVNTVAGGQTLAIASFIPVVGSGIGYQPAVTLVQEGVALQVTPSATRGGRFIVLDVHTRANLRDPAGKPGTAASAAAGYALSMATVPQLVQGISNARLRIARLSTTLRLPVDRTMLIGGMTFSSEPEPGEPNFYLFAKVSVQELRDDAPSSDAPSSDAPDPPDKAKQRPRPSAKSGPAR